MIILVLAQLAYFWGVANGMVLGTLTKIALLTSVGA